MVCAVCAFLGGRPRSCLLSLVALPVHVCALGTTVKGDMRSGRTDEPCRGDLRVQASVGKLAGAATMLVRGEQAQVTTRAEWTKAVAVTKTGRECAPRHVCLVLVDLLGIDVKKVLECHLFCPFFSILRGIPDFANFVLSFAH